MFLDLLLSFHFCHAFLYTSDVFLLFFLFKFIFWILLLCFLLSLCFLLFCYWCTFVVLVLLSFIFWFLPGLICCCVFAVSLAIVFVLLCVLHLQANVLLSALTYKTKFITERLLMLLHRANLILSIISIIYLLCFHTVIFIHVNISFPHCCYRV